jgi:hypothetical protein
MSGKIAGKLEQGTGYTFVQSGASFHLNIDQAPRSPSAPLTVFLTIENETAFATVQPGTVNQFIPKINGVFIDASPPPKLSLSGSGYIVLKVTRVQGSPFPNNAEILFSSTAPTDTTSNGHALLASVTNTNGNITIRNLISGNLNCHRVRIGGGSSTALYYWSML